MFAEDLDVFFADFGETVTLNGVAVTAVFDKEYATAGAGPLGMATSAPALSLPDASVPASPVGKPAVVRGVAYSVSEAHPDGTGLTTLLLEQA
jgi:hypothetical protein